jgi:hypothetical protein
MKPQLRWKYAKLPRIKEIWNAGMANLYRDAMNPPEAPVAPTVAKAAANMAQAAPTRLPKPRAVKPEPAVIKPVPPAVRELRPLGTYTKVTCSGLEVNQGMLEFEK